MANLPTSMQGTIPLIASVVAAHWTVAMGMVFINKNLVSGQDVHMDISVFIVWVQNVVGVFLIALMHVLASFSGWTWRPPGISLTTLIHPDMILASVTFTGTLVFNNLMLKYISVAFYQVARSLTLIFVITLSIVILREKITAKVVLSCLFIISGFYIAVDEEILSNDIRPAGVLYGILASLFAALCGVFFKRIQKKGLTSLQLTFNNCVISSIGLTPLVFSTSQISNFLYSPIGSDPRVWALLILSGAMSLTMGWISALQISLTSPLTHNISINAKSLFQTLLAVTWSGESRAWLWWIGNGLVMAGLATYTANKLAAQQNKNVMYDINMDIKEPPSSRIQLSSSPSRIE